MFIILGDREHIEQRKAEAQKLKQEKSRQMPIERFKQMLLAKLQRKNKEE